MLLPATSYARRRKAKGGIWLAITVMLVGLGFYLWSQHGQSPVSGPAVQREAPPATTPRVP